MLWGKNTLSAEELAVAHPLPMRVAAFFLGTFFLLGMMLATTPQAQADPNQVPLGEPLKVSGTLEEVPGYTGSVNEDFIGGSFNGFIKNGKVSVVGDQAFLDGRLQGTATAPSGETQKINQKFHDVPIEGPDQQGVTPQTQQEEECQILFLNIQPIFLDLLGLQVLLDEVTLEIKAVSGPGKLLGNLLCALLGILD